MWVDMSNYEGAPVVSNLLCGFITNALVDFNGQH
ncbi:hypothetical protein PIECOFPK_00080 [Mycovorax composti]|jgi:hypothetical protein|uniref:Uncharacterized protein n=1 Tax=Mycovorax composti TaxID=2962693 RepID=A0ABZ2EFW1_9BACT